MLFFDVSHSCCVVISIFFFTFSGSFVDQAFLYLNSCVDDIDLKSTFIWMGKVFLVFGVLKGKLIKSYETLEAR